MNHLLIANDFPPHRPGGISDYLFNLTNHWKGMYVLAGKGRGTSEIDSHCMCKVYRTFLGRAVFAIPFSLLYALILIRKHSIGCIHCGNASPFRWVAFIVSLITGTPYLIYYYGNDLLTFAQKTRRWPFQRMLAGAVLGRARGIVVISNFTARSFMENFPRVNRNNIFLVTPGVGDNFLNRTVTAPLLKPGGPLRLISIGRLTKRKGFDMVIRAIPAVLSAGFDLRYTLVGKGDQEQLADVAKTAGVTKNVTFLGYLKSDNDLIAEIEKSHLFIMPSRMIGELEVEGFGIVFLQAAALKRPSIGSSVGGIPDAVIDKVTGILVKNPESPEEIAEAILQFLRDPCQLSILGEAAFERVNRECNWELICRRFKERIDVPGEKRDETSL
jgi:phosphatidyl-myo-inositol dimannoside synthase